MSPGFCIFLIYLYIYKREEQVRQEKVQYGFKVILFHCLINCFMTEKKKHIGILYMNYVLEFIISVFMDYGKDEINRKNLAVILRTVKRFEKNIKQKQIERGYVKIKTYQQKE